MFSLVAGNESGADVMTGDRREETVSCWSAVRQSLSSNQMAARHRASTVALETADSRRWSSVCEYSSRTRTPAIPTYTEALIRSSQRLRERSMSPPPALPPMEK